MKKLISSNLKVTTVKGFQTLAKTLEGKIISVVNAQERTLPKYMLFDNSFPSTSDYQSQHITEF